MEDQGLSDELTPQVPGQMYLSVHSVKPCRSPKDHRGRAVYHHVRQVAAEVIQEVAPLVTGTFHFGMKTMRCDGGLLQQHTAVINKGTKWEKSH